MAHDLDLESARLKILSREEMKRDRRRRGFDFPENCHEFEEEINPIQSHARSPQRPPNCGRFMMVERFEKDQSQIIFYGNDT